MDETNQKRLFWHSRRGMLELDCLLVPFVTNVYPHLDAQNQQRYQQLLEFEDQDLFAWFMRRQTPINKDMSAIVDLILQHNQLNFSL